ncbi:MAG: hypothetical protein ACK50N_05230 [Flavobacteriales bacterium]
MNQPKSLVAVFISVLTGLIIILSLKEYNKYAEVINHDVKHYYGYLPALFIHHDIELKNSSSFDGNKEYYYWYEKGPNASKVFKTSCGVAYFYAPFFFIADAYANWHGGYLKHGFSTPYKVALLVCGLFFFGWGLLLVRKLLFKFQFSDTVVAITILLIGVGTNLLCYGSQSAPLSHVFSFFLFTAFILAVMKYEEKMSWKNALLIGLLLGLISIVRPTNLIVGLLLLFYKVHSWKTFIARIHRLLSRYDLIILMLITFILPWIPQFIYWKFVTGSYLYYPYGDEGFFWLQPKIYYGLVGFRKGWLIYTPLMITAVVGLFLLKKRVPDFQKAIVFFTILHIYVIFSWWCWWYGGSYGSRPMVDTYGILALPSAITIERITRLKKWTFPIWIASFGFFICLNIFQIFQYVAKTLHYDSMNQQLYFKQFGKLEKIEGFYDQLSEPNYDQARKGR